MKRVSSAVLIAILAVSTTACMRGVKQPALQPTAPIAGASLWERPADLASRDLYYGPWGQEHAPDPGDTFTFVQGKRSGVNLGMTVVDSKGREWSVKQPYPGGLDNEGQVEVAVSRLLSAIGYHQPPVYFVPAFTLKDDWGTHVEVGGRFRLKADTMKDVGAWSWQENPFIGKPEFNGLLVLLMMFNSTDMKNSNNTLYEVRKGDLIEQWYVSRDIGAALGDVHAFAPRKGNADAFERTPFVLGVTDGHVDFAYKGLYKNLVRDRIAPQDVAWASNLLGQLSDKQWQDAFRAAGYEPEIANRFITKMRAKIEEGRALGRRTANDDRQ
jgi:hypothetical protein